MKKSPLSAVYGIVIDFVEVHDYEVFNYYAIREIPIICNLGNKGANLATVVTWMDSPNV